MKKSDSIIKLQSLGLNTLPYFITQNKAEIMHYLAKHSEDKLSMRTERGDEFECPFYYMIPGQEMIPMALKHLEEGYKLLFSPSLDTVGCLAFGTVGYGGTGLDCIEFVIGEGKCREIYSHPKKISIYQDEMSRGPLVKAKDIPEDIDMLSTLNFIHRHLKDICGSQIPCCVEWSYYNEPVGQRKEPLIVWELRPYA